MPLSKFNLSVVPVLALILFSKNLAHAQNKNKIMNKEEEIVVAVIDTGADTLHPSLKENLWVNSGETGVDSLGRDKSTNGVDDDGNGFVDDVNGWNFAANTSDVTDRHGHGTHIAGIIRNAAPKVKLMILKYYQPKATGKANLANSLLAMRYALKMKARIINYSGGGTDKSLEEESLVEQLQQQGVLLVAAAGNERSNSDIHKFYPADYGFTNIASVTAIDENQRVLSSSNYGVKTVDIAAPGKDIYSSLPGGKFGTMTGTSQATAFVTGAAAALLAENTGMTPEKMIATLVKTGTSNAELQGKTKRETQLDASRALMMKDQDQDAFGNISMNDKGLFSTDYAAKLDPQARDLGADELPLKKTEGLH